MLRPAAFAAAILFAAPALAQPAPDSDAAFRATTLTLSSFGEARTAPDQAAINMGVTTQAPTAAAALQQNNVRMQAVIAAIRAQGVAERDIQTSGLNVNPEYEEVRAATRGRPRIAGYRVTNQVTVLVRDLDRLGATVDAVVRVGANEINGITFGLQNVDARADEARRQAVANVARKAELYARAAGLRIVRLVNLTERGGYAPPRPMAEFGRQSYDAVATSAPVQVGEVEVRVDVTAVYELGR